MSTLPSPASPADHRCGKCGAELSALGVCMHCMFLMLENEADALGGVLSLPGLEDLQELARGGMGVVYRGRETATGRIVAVKMPAMRMWGDEDAMRRFDMEVRSSALLDHANVLPVYEVGRLDDTPFFTMKYASGGSLMDQVKLRRVAGSTGCRWEAEILAKVSDAVHFAHGHGVLHRDLKPGNILFDEAGEPYVADFGLAKWLEGSAMGEAQNLTNTVTSLGTPHYLAPELASGKASTASTSTDVYALGAILYELLCGRPPHEGSSITLLLRNVADIRPEPPSRLTDRSLSKDLEAVCMKAIQTEAADRYASAGELAADLRRFLAGKSVLARPLPVAQQVWRWSRRHPAITVLGATLVLVLVVSAVIQARSARHLASAGRDLAIALTIAEGNLRDSLIAQSRLVRKSHQLGQRHDALDLIRQAAAKGGATDRLRTEATAVLATPDMNLIGEAFVFKPTANRGHSVAVTPDFRVILCRGLDDQVTLRDTSSDTISWRHNPVRESLADGFHLSDSAKYAALTYADHWLEVWDTSENKLLHSSQLLRVDDATTYVPGRPFCLHPTLPLMARVDERGALWIHDLDTGMQEQVFKGRTNVTAVAFSRSGKEVAVAGGASVETWSLSPPKQVLRFPVRDAGNVIAWHDDCLLISDRFNREVIVIQNNRIVTSFRGHGATLLAAEPAPDGRRAFSLSRDGKLFSWDYRGGDVLWEMQAGTAFIRVHENGNSLLTEGGPGRAMKWEMAPHRVFREFTNTMSFTGGSATGLEVSPDGRLVATLSNTFVVVWDAHQRRRITSWRTMGTGNGATVAFPADGRAFYGSRVDGSGIYRRGIDWVSGEVQLGEPVLVPGSEGKFITHTSADEKTWVIFDSQPRLWQPDSGQPPQPLASGTLKRSHRVSPMLRYIVPATYGAGTHPILDVKSGLPCGEFIAKESGLSLFSPGEQWLVLRESSQYRFIDPATW
ncbi:MAG TPA: WD40 repeat domain-containing serine/threonine protein kinase, partial [Candidatus Saccharimonadia bacterium]|nr:WD40 repeat domain-containing serine/threonine protein kinase [Candidatus Saccharimonadia bacterium]